MNRSVKAYNEGEMQSADDLLRTLIHKMYFVTFRHILASIQNDFVHDIIIYFILHIYIYSYHYYYYYHH